jgi:hypothetical protein
LKDVIARRALKSNGKSADFDKDDWLAPDKPLLLVAFYPKNRSPDRTNALNAIVGSGSPPTWVSRLNFNHSDWLNAIPRHRFVLAPFGHGLDTHRVTEIMLMGGVPVMRRSSISSCYDDSDNTIIRFNDSLPLTRGSLPVVIVDQWTDVTETFLLSEWQRISAVPLQEWDWRRLFAPHWLERIDAYKP